MRSKFEKMLRELELDVELEEKLKRCRTDEDFYALGFTCQGHASEIDETFDKNSRQLMYGDGVYLIVVADMGNTYRQFETQYQA